MNEGITPDPKQTLPRHEAGTYAAPSLSLGTAPNAKRLLAAGFLNPQQPDLVLEELVSLLRRARPSRREVEILLAAIAQLERMS